MSPSLTRIPVRSRRQAMDWSLVLASQGIETMIDWAEDGSGWGLIVAAHEREAATNALGQYVRENRRWHWRQPLPWPGLLFDWSILLWAVAVIVFYWLSVVRAPALRVAGAVDSSAIAAGEWWRLLTAIWLHGDLGHLASNVLIGALLLGLVMGRYGAGLGLLTAYVAGAGGNIASWLISPEPHRSLGASGMIMGGLGLLAVQSLAFARKTPNPPRYVLGSLLSGIMLFALLGSSPGTDIIAHLGGFVSGLALGAALAFVPEAARRNPRFDFACGILFALLVVVPWWLAIAHGK